MTSVSFGSVNVLPGTTVDTTGTLTITCTGLKKNDLERFCIDLAAGTDASGTQRRMASGTDRVTFDLYKDAARTQPWGNYAGNFLGGGSQNDFMSDGSGNLTATITVYARFSALQQTAVPAFYAEALIAGADQSVRYDQARSANCPTGSDTTSFTFTTTATVMPSCSVTATNLNFGSVGLLSANVDGANTVTPQCTNGTPYNVGLDAGTGAGATVSARKLTSGGNTITYSLYKNSARTLVWGTTIGTDTVPGIGSGSGQALTVYGRVPAQTTPQPATYGDTIVTTVTY
jgi:spore coat protein U-like protein